MGLVHNCIFAGVVASMALVATYAPERPHPPGQIAPREPDQWSIDSANSIASGDYRLEPRARFRVEARILSTKRHRFERFAALMPIDIALGWGVMSDSTLLDKLSLSQNGRYLSWWPRGKSPVPNHVINVAVANVHMIPSTPAIAAILFKARPGDIIVLEGDLVDVQKGDRRLMATSLSRDDSGPGACEILYVRSVSIRA